MLKIMKLGINIISYIGKYTKSYIYLDIYNTQSFHVESKHALFVEQTC